MAPVELPQLWPDLIDLLLNLLKPHQLQPDDSASDARPPDTAGGTGSANVNKHALTALSMEKVVEILSQLYRSALIPCCGALRKDIMHQDTTASLDSTRCLSFLQVFNGHTSRPACKRCTAR